MDERNGTRDERTRGRRRRGGYLFVEVVCAMLIVTTLAMVFTLATSGARVAERRLARRRELSRAAEAVLANLQAGGGVPALPDGYEAHVTTAADAPPATEPSTMPSTGPSTAPSTEPATASALVPAAGGTGTWVRVSLRLEKDEVSLIGLIPSDRVPAEKGGGDAAR